MKKEERRNINIILFLKSSFLNKAILSRIISSLSYKLMKHIFLTLSLILLLSSCTLFFDQTSQMPLVTPTPVSESTATEVTSSEIVNTLEPIRGGALIERIRQQEDSRAPDPYAEVTLVKTQETDTSVTIDVIIKNPTQAPLTSIRAFVAYNTKALQGKTVVINDDSPFHLTAPGEDDFDTDLGIAKIGVSTTELQTANDKEIAIATLIFDKKENTTTALDFFDVRDGGGTYVLMSTGDQGQVNILTQPSIPALLLSPASS